MKVTQSGNKNFAGQSGDIRKLMNNLSYTSLALKLTGVILILSSIFDFIAFVFPFKGQEVPWAINFVSNIVDRGIVPLLGIVLILIAYWIESVSGASTQKSRFDLRLPVFAFATLLGLLFLLFVPIHFSNLNSQQSLLLKQIEQGAGQGEEQIKGFLNQINTLSQNPQILNQQIEQRNQAIASGQAQGQTLNAQQLESIRQQRDQLAGLKDLAKNPQDYTKKVSAIKKNLETQLLDRRKKAEDEVKDGIFDQILRTCLSSLLLAIGYSTIGWLGFVVLRNSPNIPAKR
jgi:multisubunit Na+/H+ antiporter MnhB subunit